MEITPVHPNTGGMAQSVGPQTASGNLKPSGGVSQQTASPPVAQQSESVPEHSSNSPESQVEHAAQVANRFMDTLGLNLQFSVEKDVNKIVVKVVDTATHEVIKQYPSEEMLAISRALDKLQGLLIKTQA